MPELSILDSTIHYQDFGAGTPLVFLHGNPASSYIWRDILPHVGHGRLLAPDLIGMGASGKPDIAYSFADHARYLDAWFDALELEHVVLVGHDWGGGLAFDWTARHPDRVAGIAFLEAIIKPFDWNELSPGMRERSQAVRGPQGEQIVLEQNRFLTQAFTGGVLTPVSQEDIDAYLAPYPTPESRRPILAWVRQRPIGGEPADVVERVNAFDAWLASSSEVPKLLMTFDGEGLLIDERAIDWCAEHVAALEIVPCGQAGHHAPEDRPREIAAAINAWIDRQRLRDDSIHDLPETQMSDPQPDAAQQITATVAAWPGVQTAPHHAGVQFHLGPRELGHLHGNRVADLPFPRPIRDELIAAGRAQPHHHLPDSGWITLPINQPTDVDHAIGLFRLSYELSHGLRRTAANDSKGGRPCDP